MSRKVLILEDDRELQHLLKLLLSRRGFTVFGASGLDGLERQVREHDPDVILLDLALVDCDGVEVMHRLVEYGTQAQIVVVSGFDERIQRSVVNVGRAYGLNVLGHVSKPLQPGALAELLATMPAGVAELTPGYQAGAGAGSGRPEITPARLDAALDSDELFLVYQPKVEIATGRIRASEALVRWRWPDGTVIPPDAFIPLAERSKRIRRLTEHVVRQALEQMAAWRARGWDISVAVNVSASLLGDREFPGAIGRLLADASVSARHLILEVTESSAMADARQTADTLTRLRIMGVRLSLDDVGTGYSSLVELHRIPFTELKIDKRFIMGCHEDRDALVIANAIVGMGHALGLRVVAEGVERPEHLALLADSGCDDAQGYHFSAPLPPQRFDRWFEDRLAPAGHAVWA